MQAVWQVGTGVIKDFMQKMEDSDSTPYTTVASIVRNLERKGYVTSKKYGNTNVYSANVLLEEYKREFMGNVVRNYFTNSYRDVVSFFVEHKHISREELRELVDLIEKEGRS